jgi:dTDP-4-amino-4,6-dideoxygalactose transaminase
MKTISSPADLAINGAPPAYRDPLHVGRPNIGNRASFIQRVNQILDNQWLTNNGPMVQELEERISAYLGVKHCVAMCNGTIALEIAIRALGLTGEVIVPSWTFIATAHALYWQDITPVFADIDPETHNLCPDAVRRMITPRTTGIIGVHLWGRAGPIADLQNIANEYGLKLIFDAAHAFGSTYRGQMIGQFGACEVLSFHATKSFNTMEGGAIVTNDDQLAQTMRLMRNFGFSGYDNVIHPGTNGKMTEVSAAMGLTNLDSLQDVFNTNRRVYSEYRNALESVPGISIIDYDQSEANSHHYVVLEVSKTCNASRDRIVDALQAENILARKYFWPACHRMKPYRDLFPHAGLVLANTEALAERIVVLPAGSAVSTHDIELIARVISTVCAL